MNIYIGSDHRGVETESFLVNCLKDKGYNVFQTTLEHFDTDDYVDFAYDIATKVLKDNSSLGVLICGTGIGMSIAANKVKGIRAAHCTSLEEATLARKHNGANIICLANKDKKDMLDMIETFITTPSANEEKHLNRINKIIKIENGEYNEL